MSAETPAILPESTKLFKVESIRLTAKLSIITEELLDSSGDLLDSLHATLISKKPTKI